MYQIINYRSSGFSFEFCAKLNAEYFSTYANACIQNKWSCCTQTIFTKFTAALYNQSLPPISCCFSHSIFHSFLVFFCCVHPFVQLLGRLNILAWLAIFKTIYFNCICSCVINAVDVIWLACMTICRGFIFFFCFDHLNQAVCIRFNLLSLCLPQPCHSVSQSHPHIHSL